jgi:hypothetical protein
MKITEPEVKSVSALEDFKRYKYAIKRIADHTNVYTLKNKTGNWAISTIEQNKLFPIWPAAVYAENCIIDDWAGFEVEEISLNNFQKDLMNAIEKDGFLLNIFPVGQTTGFIVDVEEFTRDIKEELKNYE